MTEDRSDTDDERANTESAPFADHVASLPGDSGTDEAAAVDEALPDIPRADADDADDTQGPQQEFRRDRQGPLSDIASAVDERSTDAGESAFDELFEQEQVAEIDSDQLWDRLENDQPPDSFLEATARSAKSTNTVTATSVHTSPSHPNSRVATTAPTFWMFPHSRRFASQTAPLSSRTKTSSESTDTDPCSVLPMIADPSKRSPGTNYKCPYETAGAGVFLHSVS